jgi:hypothetical protein
MRFDRRTCDTDRRAAKRPKAESSEQGIIPAHRRGMYARRRVRSHRARLCVALGGASGSYDNKYGVHPVESYVASCLP